MSDKDDYVEELRVVRRKKDTYRSNSSKSDEFESDLLRNKRSKGVAGPTESRAVDEDELRERYQGDPIYVTSDTSSRELTPGQQAVADAIVEMADVVIRELIVPLVRDVAAPAAKAKFSELAERRRARALERAEAKAKAREVKVARLEKVDELEPTPVSTDLKELEPSVLMTRSEVLLAQLQLRLAEDYAAKQRWLLQHAEVTEEDLSPTLEQALTLMLEGRADSLSEAEREAVANFLRGVGRIRRAGIQSEAEEMPEKLAAPSDAHGDARKLSS